MGMQITLGAIPDTDEPEPEPKPAATQCTQVGSILIFVLSYISMGIQAPAMRPCM